MTHPTVTQALLPCPFCGGEAAIDGTRYGYPASHWAKCSNCGSCTTEYTNRASAARAWNTRATEASTAARIAALEGAVTALCRVLGPVGMTLAERECIDEPLPREAVILSFMGSGASDQVTVGEYEDAMREARAAFTATEGEGA